MDFAELNWQVSNIPWYIDQYLGFYGKQAVFFFFVIVFGSYFILNNRALLMWRARRHSLRALCAVTAKLARRGDSNLRSAALALVSNARQGYADDMYSLSVRTALPNDPFFKQDTEIAEMWKERHDAFRGLQPVKGAATQVHTVAEQTRDPYEELNSLIGLDGVKKAMTDIANRAELFEKRKRAGLPVSRPALHLVFLGNPGTGKTTVARILGRLLWKIGYLSSGHVVEVSEGEMIGQYIGETPIKVHKKIQQALGGILFIDEAYAMLNANTEKGAFSASAIAALVKFMEDFRQDIVVIVAGYPRPMMSFLESNPGLRSRFTEFITFDDYSAQELVRIYEHMAAADHYTLEKAAKDLLPAVMEDAKHSFTHNFSNGRLVRNLFEDTITFMAARLSRIKEPSREALMQIAKDDIARALDKMKTTHAATAAPEEEKAS